MEKINVIANDKHKTSLCTFLNELASWFIRNKNLRLEKLNLYSYFEEDIVELLNTCNKFNIPILTNLAAAELLIVGKIRMETAGEANKRTNS